MIKRKTRVIKLELKLELVNRQLFTGFLVLIDGNSVRIGRWRK